MPFDQSDYVVALPQVARAVPLDPAELMAHPKHMIAWLEALDPGTIVAVDMDDCSACLGATFLRAKGHPDAIWRCMSGNTGGEFVHGSMKLAFAIASLIKSGKPCNVTASRALDAIRAEVA